ncbi:allantoate deiminase 2 isoform X2 [Phalaenopsis equestris]|uniref:allantoate deiminase 2 isoform X2 n=1 Tax=Phalaenopsis equestris TaxID=78828 RepID=UPI0009E39148|nr:allantoate deiminase 2 isoform X2 [Phalaenopsis equestris]
MSHPLRRRPSFFLINGLEVLIFFLPLLLSLLCASGMEREGIREEELFLDKLRDEAISRIYQLGKVSDADNYLERTFLSPASIRAGNLIQEWMEDAGLKTWVDYMGNIHGRVGGVNATAEALLIGSHLDTVIDAGMFDGALGIICAISALKVLKVSGRLGKLSRPVEVIAFSDEEGVRFQTTFLGSAAMAGILPASALKITDKSGVSVKDALRANSLDATEESFANVKYDPESVFGYVEVHIEQGPVLESLAYPLGVVKGIAGQTRLKVTVAGSQGHAGTVPMFMRRDPMVAASELIVLLESLCKHPQNFLPYDEQCAGVPTESYAALVCTVGEISCWPSASNVIPGQVYFTVDIRAMDDTTREAIVLEFSERVKEKCHSRMVNCTIEHKHKAKAASCDKELSLQLQLAVRSTVSGTPWSIQEDVPALMSGAGHDAMAMSHLTRVGMLFVRCRGGVSHSPDEHVSDDDIWAASLALLQFLEKNVYYQ